ncbi:hypothetical protein GUJ93_ZPchr0002g23694 [Zizania palustris]|uniref:Uncharacterized protein n=1 Tax=Zizania palustris TaxID=103762 RepID=A0A8J5RIG8_ZIZPA|nr:hypothetical protein GUJ93_ZPchr0002g23694 [Zizania palustris]
MESPDRIEPVEAGPHTACHGATPAVCHRIQQRCPPAPEAKNAGGGSEETVGREWSGRRRWVVVVLFAVAITVTAEEEMVERVG